MEEQLRLMSITDVLTGLYNRRGFLALAEQQIKVADRTKKEMLLFFIDLDKMKQINDTLGHEAGDQAIKDVSIILLKTFRKSDIIGRLGGDEFAVLALNTTENAQDIITKRLYNNLNAYNNCEERRYKLSLSVGTVRYNPQSPSTLEQLIACADNLMYQQKKKNR